MLEGADQRLRIEGLLAGGGSRPARSGYGTVGERLYEVFDYEVFILTACQ